VAIAVSCPYLKALSLPRAAPLTPLFARPLARLARLEDLRAENSDADAGTLADVAAGLTRLTRLTVSVGRGACIDPLARLPALRALALLPGGALPAAALTAPLTAVETLHLAAPTLPADWARLGRLLPRLHSVQGGDLNGAEDGGDDGDRCGAAAAAPLPAVASVRLQQVASAAALVALFPGAARLRAMLPEGAAAAAPALCRLAALTRLELFRTACDPAGLAAVARAPSLRALSLRDCPLSLSGDGADAVDETAAVEAAGDLSRIEALELELEEEEWWAAPGGPAARALHVIARCCTGLRRLALVGDAERTAATAALFLRCAPCAPTQDGGVVVATWDRGDAFDGV
jgi:hypothetical protein